jgi:hypothetical protein
MLPIFLSIGAHKNRMQTPQQPQLIFRLNVKPPPAPLQPHYEQSSSRIFLQREEEHRRLMDGCLENE